MNNLYTKLKIFHYQQKIDSLAPSTDKIMPPIHIRIKPTNVCNHNCWYCAYRASGQQLGQDMVIKDCIPREKMMEIIDDIAEIGVKALTFSGGGEPFCYPYLLETVQRLVGTPVRFASLTNGSRLAGELAEIFAHHAVWIRISIDAADPEDYAATRGVSKNEFEKVLNNMKSFKKLKGKCFLGVSFIINHRNYGRIYDFAKQLKDIGVDSIKMSPCIVGDEARKNNDYHKPFFGRAKESIAKVMSELADDSFEIFDAYHELDQKFKKEYSWCPFLQILPIIGADLNIYSCQDKAYNLGCGLIGSIKDSRFKNFWFKDKSKFFRINPSVVCGHHCVANSKNQLIHEYLNADLEHLGFV